MKIVLAVFLTFFSEVAFSQQTIGQSTPDPASSSIVTKVVRVRRASAQKIAELAGHGISVDITADNDLHAIVLKGSPGRVASVEQIIRELDVLTTEPTYKSGNNIELVVSVVGGSNKTELVSESQTSEAIAPVIKQLRAIFPYKNYQLLSSMLLRSSEGTHATNNGLMRSLTSLGNNSYPSGYVVGYDEIRMVSEESKPSIHLRNFLFKTTVRTPVDNATQFQPTDIGIRTDIDLREGQKIVAGKANIDSSDLALFVVLTARIVE